MKIKTRPAAFFAVFLAVMLIMTFVSRGIYTRKLAVVSVKNIQHMRLTKNIKCSGTLEPTAVRTVFLPEGLTVERISAPEGSKVSEGDPLMILDGEQLKEKAACLKREIRESVEQDGLYSSKETPVFTESGIPVMSVSVQPGDKVEEGDELFTVDRDRLLRLINELETERNQDIINRNADLEAQQQSEEEAPPPSNTEADVLELSIEQKQKKIDRYLRLYNSGGKVCAPCGGTVTDLKIKTGELTEDTAALLIGSGARSKAAAAEKKEQLKALNRLIKQDGAVLSPAEGVVTQQTLKAGGQTGSGAAVCIADDSAPMIFSAEIPEDDAARIAVGDSADLTFRNGRVIMSDCRVASVTPSEGGFRLTIPVESSEVGSGETGQLNIAAAAEEAGDCVPNSAVKGSKNDRCIYLLRSEEGFLGEEYHAQRLSVTTGLSNEGYTALSDTGLSEDDKVICTDRELTDGQTVRVKE